MYGLRVALREKLPLQVWLRILTWAPQRETRFRAVGTTSKSFCSEDGFLRRIFRDFLLRSPGVAPGKSPFVKISPHVTVKSGRLVELIWVSGKTLVDKCFAPGCSNSLVLLGGAAG